MIACFTQYVGYLVLTILLILC